MTKKIVIIEGIPGAGKDTLQRRLEEQYAAEGCVVFSFGEEELLFSWKHTWIPEIDSLRLQVMERFLDYAEQLLREHENCAIILNRFHLSFYVHATAITKEIQERYNAIIERLRSLPVEVLIPVLEESDIEVRSSHSERKDKAWEIHVKKRLAQWGFATAGEMWSQRQREFLELVKKQPLPYRLMENQKPQ